MLAGSFYIKTQDRSALHDGKETVSRRVMGSGRAQVRRFQEAAIAAGHVDGDGDRPLRAIMLTTRVRTLYCLVRLLPFSIPASDPPPPPSTPDQTAATNSSLPLPSWPAATPRSPPDPTPPRCVFRRWVYGSVSSAGGRQH